MVDGSSALIEELSDRRNQERLRRTISRIIKKSRLLKDEKSWKRSIKFFPFSPNTSKCTIFFKLEKSDVISDEDITIVIRPDNSTEHRVLRVILQEGNKVIQKKEDYDRRIIFSKSDDSVYKKEIAAIEHDIKNFLNDYVGRFTKKKD